MAARPREPHAAGELIEVQGEEQHPESRHCGNEQSDEQASRPLSSEVNRKKCERHRQKTPVWPREPCEQTPGRCRDPVASEKGPAGTGRTENEQRLCIRCVEVQRKRVCGQQQRCGGRAICSYKIRRDT